MPGETGEYEFFMMGCIAEKWLNFPIDGCLELKLQGMGNLYLRIPESISIVLDLVVFP